MSLDESDFSEESTTEVSSEHSDWGSDHPEDRLKSPTSTSHNQTSKKRSPKNKKKRRAAQKCRELVKNLEKIYDFMRIGKKNYEIYYFMRVV